MAKSIFSINTKLLSLFVLYSILKVVNLFVAVQNYFHDSLRIGRSKFDVDVSVTMNEFKLHFFSTSILLYMLLT